MKFVGLSILAALFVGTSQAAADQPARVGDQSLTTLLWDFGRCVVDKRHDDVKAFLLTDTPDGQVNWHRVPSDRACFGVFGSDTPVTFTVSSYRGALANALVQRDFAAQRSQVAVEAVPESRQVRRTPTAAGDSRREWEAENARLADCIVHTNPEASRLWILTAPSSPEESKQAGLLTTAIDQCLTSSTIVRYFNGEVMRGPIALSYVRSVR